MPTQSFDGVLRDELRTIAESRRARGLPASAEADTPTKTARNMDLIGLAFSGGGIRSATFNLGILQGLANRNLIPHIDYLSTVSGGGYIGSWLVAWMKRCNPAPDAPARQKLEYVQSSLKSKESAEPHDPEPIRYLRRYSNYLTPKASMFSADTWTVAAIWTRNTLLNLAIIVCAFAAILVLPRAAGLGLRGVMSTGGEHWSFPPPWPEAWIAGLTLVIAVLTIGRNLWLVGDGKKGYAGHRGVQWLIVGPLVVAAAAMSEWIYRVPGLFGVEWMLWPTVAFGAQYLIIAFLARFVDGFSKQHELELPFGKVGEGLLGVLLALGSATLSGFITAALLHGVALLFRAIDQDWAPWAVITIGVPLILAVFAVGMVVQVGLMGRDLPDASREWLGRLRAWTMIYGLAWLALMAASIYGPYLVYAAGAWTAAGIGGLWGATSLGGLFASNSGKTGGQKEQSGPDLKKTLLEALALVAPYVFMAGFVVMIALGVHELVSPHKGPPKQTALAHTTTINGVPEKVTLTVGEPQRSAATVFDDRKFKYPADLKDAPLGYWGPGSFDLHNLFMLFAVALVAGAILSWRVDINEFSMHHFYKNRLVRGYLGASCGAARDPDPFIGFDNGDDLALSSLAEKDENRRQQFATGTYCGPYPILNGALNLAGGTALAWRERKAASYIFTPLYCGYDKPVVDMESNGAVLPLLPGGDLSGNGYRSTDLSSYTGGIRIGTAMAISGAAASPNMGYHTSTAIAFLLTVFNVRLGWWLGNPARGDKYSRSGPTIGLPYLAVELFGLANTDKGYINISDGGHFENLGIYELVRRHCRYIIACDGEQDGNMTFGGLGNAIRKCRTDFGVEIEIDVEQLRLKNGFSGAHCVVGKIKYPFDKNPGCLLYVKSSLTGNEETDIQQYHSLNPDFPQQTTADQWFDESQFESYRKLGLHIAETAFCNVPSLQLQEADATQYAQDKADFFSELRDVLYPPSKAIEESFTRHAEAYTQLVQAVGGKWNFDYVDPMIFTQWNELAPPDVWKKRQGRYMFFSFVQLMENVYIDLGLDDPKERSHPHNAGWLRMFQKWTITDAFRDAWRVTGKTYGRRFQKFYVELMHEELRSVAGNWLTETWRPAANQPPVIQGLTAIDFMIMPGDTGLPDLSGTVTAGGQRYHMDNVRYNGATFRVRLAGGA